MGTTTSMARDPVCGMTVDPKKAAAKRVYDGTTFYFCSPGCAKQFDGDPNCFARHGEKAQ